MRSPILRIAARVLARFVTAHGSGRYRNMGPREVADALLDADEAEQKAIVNAFLQHVRSGGRDVTDYDVQDLWQAIAHGAGSNKGNPQSRDKLVRILRDISG